MGLASLSALNWKLMLFETVGLVILKESLGFIKKSKSNNLIFDFFILGFFKNVCVDEDFFIVSFWNVISEGEEEEFMLCYLILNFEVNSVVGRGGEGVGGTSRFYIY